MRQESETTAEILLERLTSTAVSDVWHCVQQ